MTKNEERAARGVAALAHYGRDILKEAGPVDDCTVIDLVTDILHAIRLGTEKLHGIDLLRVVAMAENHVAVERACPNCTGKEGIHWEEDGVCGDCAAELFDAHQKELEREEEEEE